MKIVNFKQLSDLGLIVEINHKILHPLGLALCYDEETGISAGALVADDFVWEYGDDNIISDAENKIRDFKENKEDVLKYFLEICPEL